MKVTVSNIPDTVGLDVTVAPDKAWVRRAVEGAIEAGGDASGALLFMREVSKVSVTGALAVTSSARICERCGELVPVKLDVNVDLTFLPIKQAPSTHVELELQEDDLDVGYYEDDEISVEDLVCEAIALELPSRIECEDVAACDERTARLIAERGAAGSPGEHPFATLKGRFH